MMITIHENLNRFLVDINIIFFNNPALKRAISHQLLTIDLENTCPLNVDAVYFKGHKTKYSNRIHLECSVTKKNRCAAANNKSFNGSLGTRTKCHLENEKKSFFWVPSTTCPIFLTFVAFIRSSYFFSCLC